jgi:hypothetical protein
MEVTQGVATMGDTSGTWLPFISPASNGVRLCPLSMMVPSTELHRRLDTSFQRCTPKVWVDRRSTERLFPCALKTLNLDGLMDQFAAGRYAQKLPIWYVSGPRNQPRACSHYPASDALQSLFLSNLACLRNVINELAFSARSMHTRRQVPSKRSPIIRRKYRNASHPERRESLSLCTSHQI